MVEYNKEIGNKIYTLFITNNKHKKLYFNQILKNIFPSINPKTNKYERKNQEILRRHLNIMLEQKILERDENLEIGKPRYYWLSEKTKWELRNNIFEGVVSNREDKRRKDRNPLRLKELDQLQKRKVAFRLLISYISRGSFVFNNHKDGQPLDLHFDKDGNKKGQFYSITMLKGFRISDLLNKNRILADDRQYRYIDLSKQEIESLIKILKNENPPLIYVSGIHSDGELLYDISNEDTLKTLVFHCEDMLFWLKRRIEMKWTCNQYKKEEMRWYCNIYGREKAMNFFTKEKEIINGNIRNLSKTVIFSKESKENKKFNDMDNQIQKKIKTLEKKIKEEQIQQYDEIIKDKIQWIQQQQQKLKKKYGYVCDFIIKDIYPQFLKQEYKRLYNF